MDAHILLLMYRDEAEAQVKRYAKADYKKFTTMEEAEAYLSGPVEDNMTNSDRESHMDQASCSQYVIWACSIYSTNVLMHQYWLKSHISATLSPFPFELCMVHTANSTGVLHTVYTDCVFM